MHWSTSFVLAALLSTAQADILSEDERSALLEKLESVLENSQQELTKRQGSAYSAYQKGIQSDSAALALHLKCVELTEFTQKGLRDTDFREWKRKNDNLLSDSGYKRALRHQLNWLVLSIEASTVDPQKKEDRKRIQMATNKRLTELYKDAENLTSKDNKISNLIQKELSQSVFSSSFAKAYGFHTLKIKGWAKSDSAVDLNIGNNDSKDDWPNNPKATANIFQKLIFPVYREEQDIASLRKAWEQMILFLEIGLQSWGQEAKYSGRSTKDLPTPALITFQRDKKPNLLWQLEVDLFSNGDQRKAATNMFQHLDDHLTDNKCAAWTQQLIGLLSPEEE